MKTSNVILLLIGGAIVYYLVTNKPKKVEVVDPNDVTKWDDAKVEQYLVDACGVKKKGLITGTHEKPKLLDATKQEAIKRGLSIPKCLSSSIDTIDQSFNCPKCGKAPCRCRAIGVNDLVNNQNYVATGDMPKCGEGTKFINGRCLPIPKRKQKRLVTKSTPPEESYAFPKYVNPQGEGYTLEN